jgi:hypothetical protein
MPLIQSTTYIIADIGVKGNRSRRPNTICVARSVCYGELYSMADVHSVISADVLVLDA